MDLLALSARLIDEGTEPGPNLPDRIPFELSEIAPEVVVRNIGRAYGGWYDGNRARLKPAPEVAIAREVAVLAGGTAVLCGRARALADGGKLRLACQLVEWAVQAAPDDREAHAARAEVYAQRRDVELSLLARGIFGAAPAEGAAAEGAAAEDAAAEGAAAEGAGGAEGGRDSVPS